MLEEGYLRFRTQATHKSREVPGISKTHKASPKVMEVVKSSGERECSSQLPEETLCNLTCPAVWQPWVEFQGCSFWWAFY